MKSNELEPSSSFGERTVPTERWNIDAGDLRISVTIQKRTDTGPDSRGHPIWTWRDLKTCVPAKIESPAGRKLEVARQYVPTATHLVTMRYRQLSAKEHRIVFRDRVFNIGWVHDIEERNIKLELTCTEEL
jgi:SPP1 family predicted phage head-tail adaptor